MSTADEILKYKQLLDEQIITQEEFELKKKELLDESTIKSDNAITEKTSMNGDCNHIENLNKEKPKKGKVYKWFWNIIGILIIIGSLGEISSNTASGIVELLIGVIILPMFSEFLLKKFKINLSAKWKIIICIILITINGSITVKNISTTSVTNETKNTIVFDAMQFYNDEKSDTITEQELVAIKGEPSKIENWNYEMNENTSYPITSYMYTDEDEEYQFYEGKLVVILITKEIQYKSKNSILSMFNLSNKNASKIVDNGSALRYKNCGVNDFWIQGFDNNTFNWVKIKLVESVF